MKDFKKRIRLETLIKFVITIAIALLYLINKNSEELLKQIFLVLLVLYAIYTIIKALFSNKDFTLPVISSCCFIYLLFKAQEDGDFNIMSMLFLFIVIEALNNILAINRYRKRIKYSFRLKLSQYALLVVALFLLYVTLTGNQETTNYVSDLSKVIDKYVNNVQGFLMFILLAYTAFSTVAVNLKVNRALKKLEKAKKDYDKEINREQAWILLD